MAGPEFKVKGVELVQANLARAIAGIKGNISDGIETAAVFIKGESQKLVSIKEGLLIKTAFNKSIGTKDEPSQVVGYTAKYAAAVHEMPDDTKWNKPGAENEFLEKPVVRNLSSIMNIIRNVASKRPI